MFRGPKMKHARLISALILISIGTVGVVFAAFAQENVREQRIVRVDGHNETWKLVVNGKLNKVCRPRDPDSAVCPCSGFEDADAGKFSIVRYQGGREIDRLELAPLFGSNFPLGLPGTAWLLQRHIFKLADYDHSGKALEFLLQVDTAPCGKPVVVAIGVSAGNPRLHALSAVETPGEPLMMSWTAWRSLLAEPGPFTITTWSCGDHGSDTETDATLSAVNGAIHYTTSESQCPGVK